MKTSKQIDEYLFRYGFGIVKNVERTSEDNTRNFFQLVYNESDIIGELYGDDLDEAYRFFYPIAQEYVKKNNLSLKPDEIEADADSDEYVVYALSLFLRDETLDECPIRVVSRKYIEGEAQLINFVFGKDEEPCVAIVYNDGTTFTPYDWQDPMWRDNDWSIEDVQWMDCNFNPCINFNGMPRMLC